MTYHLSNAALYLKYLDNLDADKSYADAYYSLKTSEAVAPKPALSRWGSMAAVYLNGCPTRCPGADHD